jgi:adenylyltransferase/sulfurtransferase
MTRINDEQIERYSRQLILAEVGPHGQERLGSARVAVVGDDVAAGRVAAYLAAAGVGWIAAEAALHAVVDPAQPDLRVVALTDAAPGPLDAVVLTGATVESVAATLPAWTPRAATYWIAGGRAGGCPPCPRCAAAALPPAGDVARELTALRSAVLGTIVATEVVKGLLAIGVPLAGRVLDYDPATATITGRDVATRADCACRRVANAGAR